MRPLPCHGWGMSEPPTAPPTELALAADALTEQILEAEDYIRSMIGAAVTASVPLGHGGRVELHWGRLGGEWKLYAVGSLSDQPSKAIAPAHLSLVDRMLVAATVPALAAEIEDVHAAKVHDLRESARQLKMWMEL